MSWQPKNTASSAQSRVTRSANCYLSSTRRHHAADHHVVGTMRRTDHHPVGIKRQLKPNYSTPHRNVKIEKRQLGVLLTTFDRTRTME